LNFQLLGKVIIFILYGNNFVKLKLLDLLLSFWIKNTKILLAADSYRHAGLYLWPMPLVLARLRNIVAWYSNNRGGCAWPDTIKRNQAYLVEVIKAIKMALMQQDFEQGTSHRYAY